MQDVINIERRKVRNIFLVMVDFHTGGKFRKLSLPAWARTGDIPQFQVAA
jgi:hypothetical protein